MTRSPTRLDRYVWPTPIRPVTMGIAIISATRRYRTGRSGWQPDCPQFRPRSNTSLIRSGFATPSPDVMTIATPTTPTRARYGLKVSTTRRTVERLIGRFSSSGGTWNIRP